MVCSHRATVVTFPDGTAVRASSYYERSSQDTAPDYGIYCAHAVETHDQEVWIRTFGSTPSE
jgi:hypothetical protein